jgi:hypothetical protein
MACSSLMRSRVKQKTVVCGAASRLYAVSGIFTGLDLELCTRHRRQLERWGLTCELCGPLVQSASRAEAQRAAGLRTIAKPGEPGYVDNYGTTAESMGDAS